MQRHILVCLTAQGALFTALFHIGIFKQAQHELHPQNPAAGLVQHFFLHLAVANQLCQTVAPLIVGIIEQLEIHTGLHTQTDRFLTGGRHKMPVIQAHHGGHVGTDKTGHSKLAAEHIGQNFVVHGNGDSVNSVIGAHGVDSAAFHKGFLKHRHTLGKHFVTAHSGGCAVQTGHRVAVSHIVLGLCRYRVRVFQRIAL